MRNLLFASLCVFIILLSSCKGSEYTVDANPEDIMQALAEQFSDLNTAVYYFSEGAENERLGDNEALALYSSDTNPPDLSAVEHYSIRQGSISSAAEVGIFKVYNKSDVEKISDMCKVRLQNRQKYFSEYNQTEAAIANNAEVRVYGHYVYYVILKDKDDAFSFIEDILRGKKELSSTTP